MNAPPIDVAPFAPIHLEFQYEWEDWRLTTAASSHATQVSSVQIVWIAFIVVAFIVACCFAALAPTAAPPASARKPPQLRNPCSRHRGSTDSVVVIFVFILGLSLPMLRGQVRKSWTHARLHRPQTVDITETDITFTITFRSSHEVGCHFEYVETPQLFILYMGPIIRTRHPQTRFPRCQRAHSI